MYGLKPVPFEGLKSFEPQSPDNSRGLNYGPKPAPVKGYWPFEPSHVGTLPFSALHFGRRPPALP
jgi:hypothetical protein